MDGRLNFSVRRKLPVIQQTEAAECGLACLAMIASYHGHETELPVLRRRFSTSLKGATLTRIMEIASALELSPRALRLDIDDLGKLRLPAVLHWDMNHFVVLRAVGRKHVVIHDPARGRHRVSLEEVSRRFTGIALELSPTGDFKPRVERQEPLRMRDLWGRAHGVPQSLVQILAISLALQGLMLISPWFLQLTVDNVLLSRDVDLLTVLGVGFGILVVVQSVIGALRSWMVQYLGTNLGFQILNSLFRHLIRLPMEYFFKRHVGDVISRLSSATEIQKTFTTGFIEALVDGVMVIATLVVMFLYSPVLAGVVLGVALLYALIRWLSYARLRDATEEEIVAAARKESSLLESIRGVQTVRLFRGEVRREGGWQNLLADQLNAAVRVARVKIGLNAANSLLFGLENVIVIWLGARIVMDGNFSVGMLIAFMAYKRNFSTAAAALIERLLEFRMLELHLERVADIALKPREATETTDASLSVGGHVSVQNVCFRYSTAEPMLLDSLSFEVRPGESVAITGPSGCGKTTLVKILLGLIVPTSGKVLVDGIDVHGSRGVPLRAHFATVMQDDTLFAGSIADNICFFDESPDMQRIVACATAAGIHGEIMSGPMGYETLVGDMGTTLSGGQKQRVMLARALYSSPRVLFLDEATSHLDVALERQVSEAVQRLGMTRIIIAHRPETIAHVDRVIDLGDLNRSTSGNVNESTTPAYA